jgi:UDP-N-acetylglucosamine acyltransferase
MPTLIHPSAIVEDGAQLGVDCEIQAGAIVTRYCRLGDRVVVHPYAVLGGDPQYVKFDRAIPSFVEIGAGSVFREHVTVNRSIHADGSTRIGANCYMMSTSHVGHDCVVGDNVVFANAALLAGHVALGDHSFMGGGAAVHQYVRIGESAMVGGHASITRDVPHFTMVVERDDVIGFNVVGLRRRGFARAAITELKAAFREVYVPGGSPRELAKAALETQRYATAEAQSFLGFFAGGTRNFVRPRRARDAEPGATEAAG